MGKEDQDLSIHLSSFYKGSMSGESWDDFIVRRMQAKREVFSKDPKSNIPRKWGTYEILEWGDNYLVKLLTVHPRKNISFQRHRHRCEQWLVLEGKGLFVLDKDFLGDLQKFEVTARESILVPPMAWHWVKNTSYNKPLCILETWFGDILEESDIEREDYDETAVPK